MGENLLEWLEVQQNTSTMSAEQIPLTDVEKPWGMNENNYQREDKGFFRVTGIRITNALREVKKWTQAILEELGPLGVVALIREQTYGLILVTAKAEPGNDAKGCVLLAPSLQASQANLKQIHGGKKPPLAEILDMPETQTLHQSNQPQDGGRFFRKKVDVRIIEIPNPETISALITDQQIWCTRKEIDETLLKGVCNPHLRDTLSVLDALDRTRTQNAE